MWFCFFRFFFKFISLSLSLSRFLDIDNHPHIRLFLLLPSFILFLLHNPHRAIGNRFDLGARNVPLPVKPLSFTHRLQRETSPVYPSNDGQFSGSEALRREGEEELVEEGEEEGVEVVARGGEAA